MISPFGPELALRRSLGQRVAMPALLEDIAGLAAHDGQHTRALTLVGAAAILRQTLGAPRSAVDQNRVGRWLESTRIVLGAKSSVAWDMGQPVPLDQALTYAVDDDDSLACYGALVKALVDNRADQGAFDLAAAAGGSEIAESTVVTNLELLPTGVTDMTEQVTTQATGQVTDGRA